LIAIRFLLPARLELQEAVAYYSGQLDGLGDTFRDETWDAIRRIADHPHAWHPLGGEIRRCQLRHFPYGVIYEPLNSEIVIISIAGLHRRPGYWQDRL
jgi:hypothetical protein